MYYYTVIIMIHICYPPQGLPGWHLRGLAPLQGRGALSGPGAVLPTHTVIPIISITNT